MDGPQVVSVDRTVEAGVKPGCVVLRGGDGRQWRLLGPLHTLPHEIPLTITGTTSPGLLSTCQQGETLQVRQVELLDPDTEPGPAVPIATTDRLAGEARIVPARAVRIADTTARNNEDLSRTSAQRVRDAFGTDVNPYVTIGGVRYSAPIFADVGRPDITNPVLTAPNGEVNPDAIAAFTRANRELPAVADIAAQVSRRDGALTGAQLDQQIIDEVSRQYGQQIQRAVNEGWRNRPGAPPETDAGSAGAGTATPYQPPAVVAPAPPGTVPTPLQGQPDSQQEVPAPRPSGGQPQSSLPSGAGSATSGQLTEVAQVPNAPASPVGGAVVTPDDLVRRPSVDDLLSQMFPGGRPDRPSERPDIRSDTGSPRDPSVDELANSDPPPFPGAVAQAPRVESVPTRDPELEDALGIGRGGQVFTSPLGQPEEPAVTARTPGVPSFTGAGGSGRQQALATSIAPTCDTTSWVICPGSPGHPAGQPRLGEAIVGPAIVGPLIVGPAIVGPLIVGPLIVGEGIVGEGIVGPALPGTAGYAACVDRGECGEPAGAGSSAASGSAVPGRRGRSGGGAGAPARAASRNVSGGAAANDDRHAPSSSGGRRQSVPAGGTVPVYDEAGEVIRRVRPGDAYGGFSAPLFPGSVIPAGGVPVAPVSAPIFAIP